jgi:hypothetical protein
MPRPVELGTFQVDVEVVNGQGFPRMEFLQNNLQEALPLIPDGRYRWTFTMALNNANRLDRTIQQYVEAGVIACPDIGCGGDRLVGKDAQVQPCGKCGDARFWNLMVTTR